MGISGTDTLYLVGATTSYSSTTFTNLAGYIAVVDYSTKQGLCTDLVEDNAFSFTKTDYNKNDYASSTFTYTEGFESSLSLTTTTFTL